MEIRTEKIGIRNISKSLSSTPFASNYKAFFLMSSIFFVMGFVGCLNDILIPHLKSSFNLSYAEAMLIQTVWFFTVFLISVPSGLIVERFGYKKAALISLFVAAVGLAAMWPVASLRSYPAFLAAIFVTATGVTLMQVVLNPYISLLGTPEKAASRLALSQALNSFGTFLAPFFGGLFILGSALTLTQMDAMSATQLIDYRESQADAVKLPYLGIAIFLLIVMFIFAFNRIPEPGNTKSEVKKSGSFKDALSYPQVKIGIIAMFCYVGAEVAVGSFLINYISLPEIGNMTESRATTFVALYWGGAMIGRLIGAAIMTRVSSRLVLGFFAAMNILLLIITMAMGGWISVISVVLIGFFNSIMFASIFTICLNGISSSISQATGILIMAQIGGALVPLTQGFIADGYGVQHSFILPLICYLFILFFSKYSIKFKK
ncbi:sugar MFS transporter [Acinetobacter baumannii]|uniref:sugar MFS transporter n=1 Tax=Acinetobacter baumannii TaxID=470 RepID=UPI00244BFE8C|nr:sugar MFS transporter [Acinetobacter baumannii]MDH2622547.1 sugar MFS transporter [Acinetobacter baumannii]